MANLDFDPTQAVDPATGLPLSRPIPGMAAAAIPGILGVVSPGLWDRAGAPFASRFPAAEVNAPSDRLASETPTGDDILPGTTSRIVDADRPQIGANAAVGRLGLNAPGRINAEFPAPAPPAKTVQTTREGAGSDAPGMPLATTPEENAAIPPTAMPTQGALTPGGGSHLFPEGSLLDRLVTNIGNFRDANRLTLLAMAGGLAGSQNWGTGLSRAFTAAVPAQRADIALGNQNATINYLVSHGFPPDLARSVGTSPQLMQEAIGQMTGLSPPKAMTLQGPMGASLMQWNPQTRKWEMLLAAVLVAWPGIYRLIGT